MKLPILRFASYALLLFGVGLVGAWIAFNKHPRATQSASAAPRAAQAQSDTGERQPLYWYDPMVPSQHFDKPGKSPFMDMQLVPKYADEGTAGGSAPEGSIAIDPRVVQNLGVRIAPVEQGPFARAVDTVGLVGVDEHRIRVVQVRAPGWVERLEARAAGDPVRRGQLLASVYSPDLLAAQQDFLIALGLDDAGLIRAGRERLALLGLSDGQIAHVEQTRQAERRVDYYSPLDGYAMELGVRDGSAVQTDTVLFTLVDLSTVWINIEVPETQAAWIRAGDPAQAEVPALPGEIFKGQVDYVYPELTPATRTLKLRVVFENPKDQLRPGMFVTTHLQGARPGAPVLDIPRRDFPVPSRTRNRRDRSAAQAPAVLRLGTATVMEWTPPSL